MQVFAGSIAATSGARCSSRGEISSEPAISSSESRPWDSVALTGDDIGLVQKPERAVLLQHLARRIEVLRVAEDLGQALVLDLGYVNRRVPGGEQRRGADAR